MESPETTTARFADKGAAWRELVASCLIGASAVALAPVVGSPLYEPLLASLLAGMLTGSLFAERLRSGRGIALALRLFIPPGILLYGFLHLNFARLAKVPSGDLALLAATVAAFFLITLLLGRAVGLRKKIIYLVAVGSAVCGASAVAILAPAVESEPDDISVSLVSLAGAAAFGLYLLMPFTALLADMTATTFGMMSGAVLQFTGFVKAAVNDLPAVAHDASVPQVMALALSVKSVRYLLLIAVVPVFGSMIRRRLYMPWYLWGFLAAGICGTIVQAGDAPWVPASTTRALTPVLGFLWASAMAALGLNADVRALFSDDGVKAAALAFAGMGGAIAVFTAGTLMMR